VIIYNSDYKFALRYAHLDWYDESLNGKWISATSDTPIGKVGKTGLGTGPHLHLVLYKNVDSIESGNPVRYSSCSVENGECAKSATNYAAQFSFHPRPTTQSLPFSCPSTDSLGNYISSLTGEDSKVQRAATEAIDDLKSEAQTEIEMEMTGMLRGILKSIGIPQMWINYLLP
jgi:murein DD-endopeptidase MepM/ murein hydrolase activator NlpD